MRIELLCTGDELLAGLTPDTNSPTFMAQVFALGEQVRQSTLVGDDRAEIIEALRTLGARADVVLVSGGLGPTADDLTAECAAEAASVKLVEHPATRKHLEARFIARGRVLTANNFKQALVPEGSEVVQNPEGTAPLFILTLGQALMYFVPGVPREYRALVEQEVLPRIAARMAHEPGRIFRASRLLKTVGLPESHLDARVEPLGRRHPHVQLGFRTAAPENHLKLLAVGASQGEADARLRAAESDARDELGVFIFGSGAETFAEALGKLLVLRGETLTLAESCTGGRVSDMLTAVAGSSRYFFGGAVSYANALKERWLDVREATLMIHGAVSESVAREMAAGARAAGRSTWALSLTGIAGPEGGTVEKPVGTVFIGLAGARDVVVERHLFHGDREQIRAASAYAALELLRRTLIGARDP